MSVSILSTTRFENVSPHHKQTRVLSSGNPYLGESLAKCIA